MAKSSARKKREHRVRQGKLNPENSRGSWNGVMPVTKVKPNKKKDHRFGDYDRAYNIVVGW
jgi:hypothetical protein